jgi:hypothetical protein
LSLAQDDQANGFVDDTQSPKRRAIPWRIRLSVLAPSLFLYATACVTPAVHFFRIGGGPEGWYGIEALLLGWQGAFVGQFGWFANALLLVAAVLILFRRFAVGSIFATMAVAVATDSLLILHQQIPGDEGDVTHLIVTGFGIGFCFWFASLLAAVVAPIAGALFVKYRYRAPRQRT